MSTARRSASLLALLLLLAPALGWSATRYDPRLRFRTYRTPHFDIHAHQGEERLAARLAAIAERVRARLQPALGVPRGRVQVILVDQTDVSNGWATPFPYDAIEISAAPPTGESLIGNTTDWLELVFTHEYTHILHLDRSRGFMQGVRRVFGRAPLVFPNAYLPLWQIEGLATYEESRMTGQGRVPAGDFRAIVAAAARQGRFSPIDRAGGGLDEWPAGNAPYAYGAYFHQYLSDRFGPDRVDALADATAGRLPLFGMGAFPKVFGASAGSLWREFRAAQERDARPAGASDAAARRLTRHGYLVAAPRADAEGAIFYRLANADGFPALMRLERGIARRVAWRVGGDRTSPSGDWVAFDAVERTRSIALYSDLYAVRRSGGEVVRLTKEARAAHPDVSPDGRRIACVVLKAGYRALAIVDFDPRGPSRVPRIVADDPESDFSGPRWSPDGTRIVAERRRAGLHELVLADPATGAVQPLLSRANARLVTPSWSRDGRAILFAADPGGEPFNIFSVEVSTGLVRRVTDTASGATFPEPAPDGSLIYVGYTADGYDLFSLPPEFRLAESRLDEFPAEVSRSEEFRLKAEATDRSDVYRPFRTLVPTYWQPVVETDADEVLVGAGTAMTDALGRHGYAASAAWSAERARPDWNVSYAYDRWRPTIVAAYSDDTDPIRGGELRTRELFTGVLLPFRQLRWTQALMGGFDASHDTAACSAPCRSARRDLRSARAGWSFDSRRVFARSVSAEEGVVVEAAVESSRKAFGSDADSGAFVVDARAFQRVFSRHTVLALRLAGAGSTGDAAGQRVFSAAGSGAPSPSFDFGRDTIGLLRGFDPEDVIGTRAAVANVDLRVPLLRVQRGAGTLPIFLRSVHAAAFLDAGSAWQGRFRAADVRYAAGGELSLDAVGLYSLRFTLAGGVAWTHDPVAARDRVVPFARIGYAF